MDEIRIGKKRKPAKPKQKRKITTLENRDDYTGKPCNFCKIPVISKDDYTAIPAHVICVARFLDGQKKVIKAEQKQQRKIDPVRDYGTVFRLCVACRLISFSVPKHSSVNRCSLCMEANYGL